MHEKTNKQTLEEESSSEKLFRMHYIYIVLYTVHPPNHPIIVNSNVERLQFRENYIHLSLAQSLLYETSYYLIPIIMV